MAKRLPEGTKANPHFLFPAGIMNQVMKLNQKPVIAALQTAVGRAIFKIGAILPVFGR
jgi:hypothetical protein